MTQRDTQDQRSGLSRTVHEQRTRVVAALIGFLVSLGVPVVVLGAPVPTVHGRAVGSLDDPAGLGITGALPGDPLPGDPVPGDPLPGDPLAGVVPDGKPGESVAGIPTPPNLPDGPLGIPGAVLDAYQFAQRTLASTRPGCHLSWSLLAGIGRIESGHASDGRVDPFGNTLGPILGPRLDGSPGMAAIPDTDHGVLDGDLAWDRAVGPMQFIPSSWRSVGVDGNGDGVANPNNIYDSTIATGIYLCTGGTDLADPTQLQAAIFRYNHSATYVAVVLLWAQAYLTDVVPTRSAPGPVPAGTNGNGGAPTLVDGSQAVAAQAAIAQSTPPAPPTTSSPPSASPPATTPTPEVTLSPQVTPSPQATPSPETIPSSGTTPSPETTPSTATTPPTTDSSPSPAPLPTSTMAPVDPASGPPPSPPRAGP